jgi:hypothetical protein
LRVVDSHDGVLTYFPMIGRDEARGL